MASAAMPIPSRLTAVGSQLSLPEALRRYLEPLTKAVDNGYLYWLTVI